MKNLYINKAETIFEMFWDAGDSYPDHHKYSCIDQYGQRGEGRTRVSWNGIQVFSEGRFLLSRELQLDISEFDILIVRMDLPVSLEFAVYCVIDGVKTRIIYSNEDEYEFEGIICGKRLSNIELEFCNKGAGTAPALLLWLGLANSRKREAMLSENNGYGKDCWEGCFQENFEIKPHLSAYFKEEELEAIRENAYGKYADIFSKLQKDAEKLMGYEIEQYIGKYVDYTSPRFGRKRDIGKDVPCFLEMSTLAFVGLINQDTEMLKMACRYALSASCCTYWCEGILGEFPGATWHHRSFLEGAMSSACAKVLDWAGELLTWHGRNIIYNAIIMKGLPRLEADIHTMDYIWHMNQGIVFTSSLLITLLALVKRYPRYAVSIDRYEKALLEMWHNYVNEDGGVGEGAGYWNYSAMNFFWTMYLLAEHRGKTMQDYLFDDLKISEKYVKAMISTVKEGGYLIPVNDCRLGGTFSVIILAFLAIAGENRAYWSKMFDAQLKSGKGVFMLEELLILAKDIVPIQYREKDLQGYEKDFFASLLETGIVSLMRSTEDIGKTALFVQCGPPEKGHEHEDKGSFILEAGGKEIIIDRGVCAYGQSNEYDFKTAKWHNLLYPECGKEMHQLCGNDEKRGRILKCRYEDGIFVCSMDLTAVWNGIFHKNIRTIISPNPKLYIIFDNVTGCEEVSFRLNTREKIKDGVIVNENIRLYVHAVNWKPDKVEGCEEGTDGEGYPVNQLRLYGSEARTNAVKITALELSTAESRLRIGDNHLFYDEVVVFWKDDIIAVNGKEI